MNFTCYFFALPLLAASICSAQASLSADKQALTEHVDKNAKLAQVMVDTVFSFGELGFQEAETSKYLTVFLKRTASRSSEASRVFQRHGLLPGVRASLSSRLDRTSTVFRRRRRSLALHGTIRSSPVLQAMVKVTIPVSRSTYSPRLP